MQFRKSPRRGAGTRLAAALALASALTPQAAWAAAGHPGEGDLSARLAELARPAVRSAPPAKQATMLGLPAEGPGSLLRAGSRVLIEVRFDHGAAAGAGALRAAGAKVLDLSPRYQAVTVAAKPAELRRLSDVPRVTAATEVLAPIVYGVGGPGPMAAAATPCFGAATSEGDEQLRTARARAEFGVDGSGVRVGVLSDSFDRDELAETHQAEDVASGDLPGPGNPCGREAAAAILDDSEAAGEDEGRAMAQIVHDLAPGAQLSFATAFTGLTAFAANVKALAAAGAKVIADDVSYFEEPFFQEGPVGVAVGEVAGEGVSYFSSTGNNNLINGGRDIASWEAPQYRDSGGCPLPVVALSAALEANGEPGLHPTHCMDFDPGPGVDRAFRITVSQGATLTADLQWAEPWQGVTTDVDAYLLGPEGAVVAGSVEDNVFASQRPFELVGWENETGAAADVQLAINRYSGATSPRLKLALLQNGGGVTSTEYESSPGGDVVGPTIFGHNGAAEATSVGAIRYDTNSAPERFSSRGPVTHYFGPVDGVSPAAELPSPETLAKPDVVASDGGASTFFGSCLGVWRFFGTSAAAPHAAAVAALEREAKPSATAAEVSQAQREGAATVGAFPPGAVGAGMVDAVAAIEALGVSPSSPGALPEPAPPSAPCSPVGPAPEPQPTQPPTPVGSGSGSGQGAPSADRTAPSTFFRRRPPKTIRTRRSWTKAVFRFGSNESDVTFLCQVDSGPLRRCPARFVRRYRDGPHTLRVTARDAAGDVDRTPAVYRFRVQLVGA